MIIEEEVARMIEEIRKEEDLVIAIWEDKNRDNKKASLGGILDKHVKKDETTVAELLQILEILSNSDRIGAESKGDIILDGIFRIEYGMRLELKENKIESREQEETIYKLGEKVKMLFKKSGNAKKEREVDVVISKVLTK